MKSKYRQVEIKDFKTELLDYPCVLGDSTRKKYLHGCIICQRFRECGIHEEPQNIYNILTTTAKDKETYNKWCLESTFCAPLIQKFLNGTYKAKYDGGDGDDDISVFKMDGKYCVDEGKHRVCIAKRFDIKEIPVVFTEEYPG
jgi:hypothetical protein